MLEHGHSSEVRPQWCMWSSFHYIAWDVTALALSEFHAHKLHNVDLMQRLQSTPSSFASLMLSSARWPEGLVEGARVRVLPGRKFPNFQAGDIGSQRMVFIYT
eukprot:6316271-Amphidinium_carterae.1